MRSPRSSTSACRSRPTTGPSTSSPGPFADPELGLTLLESELDYTPDPYLAAYLQDHDAQKFALAVSGMLRAFTEPSLFGALHRADGARTTLADGVYARVAQTAAADPEAMETLWHVAVLRIAKPA